MEDSHNEDPERVKLGLQQEREEDGADGDGFDADRMGGLLCISQFVCSNNFLRESYHSRSLVKCHLQLSLASDVCSQLLAREAQPLDRSSRVIGGFF